MNKHFSKKIKVVNRDGIHARPSVKIVETANQFSSKIYIIKDDMKVDGKSILEILTLAASFGSELVVEADGKDAEEAVESISRLLSTEFHFHQQDSQTSV